VTEDTEFPIARDQETMDSANFYPVKGVTEPRRLMQKNFCTSIDGVCHILDSLLERNLQSRGQWHGLGSTIRQHVGGYIRLSGVVSERTHAA
jgi:hypothetical protein